MVFFFFRVIFFNLTEGFCDISFKHFQILEIESQKQFLESFTKQTLYISQFNQLFLDLNFLVAISTKITP